MNLDTEKLGTKGDRQGQKRYFAIETISFDSSPKCQWNYRAKLFGFLRYFITIETVSADRSPKYWLSNLPKISGFLRYIVAIKAISADRSPKYLPSYLPKYQAFSDILFIIYVRVHLYMKTFI